MANKSGQSITVSGLWLDNWTNPFDATAEELVACALDEAAVTSPHTMVNGVEIAVLMDAYSGKRQRFREATRLGSLLVEEGLISEDQLKDALAVQKQETLQMARAPRPLGQILVSMHVCTELQIARTLGQQDALRVEATRFDHRHSPVWQKLGQLLRGWFRQPADKV
jgi:hypothetical protein